MDFQSCCFFVAIPASSVVSDNDPSAFPFPEVRLDIPSIEPVESEVPEYQAIQDHSDDQFHIVSFRTNLAALAAGQEGLKFHSGLVDQSPRPFPKHF